jgi:hypothetical protein
LTECTPEELPFLAGDFEMQASMRKPDGSPSTTDAVDGRMVVRLTVAEGSRHVDPLALSVYIDRSLSEVFKPIRLPYDLKWNFRGLSEGRHQMVLVLVERDGTRGVVRLDIGVERQ